MGLSLDVLSVHAEILTGSLLPPSQLGHTVLIVILVLNMKKCYIYKITFHVRLKFGVNESSSALLMVHYTYFIDVF